MNRSKRGNVRGEKRNHIGVRSPAKAFKCCPYCDRQDTFTFDGQVFCNHCGWNSLSAHCEALDLAESYRDARPSRPAPLIEVFPRGQENIETALGELSIA